MALLHHTREVRADLTCRHCGYNLRGLTSDRNCPECGTGVEWSMRGYQLRYADPAWMKKLNRGMSLILTSVGFGFLSLMGLAMLAAGFASTNAGGEVFIAITIIWAQLLCVIALLGVWKLTTIEPRVAASDPVFTYRFYTRGLGTVALTSWILLLAYFGFGMPVLDEVSHVTVAVITGALPLLWAITFIVFMGHLRTLSTRMTSPHLKSWTTTLIYFAAFLICGTIASLILPRGFTEGLGAICLACMYLFAIVGGSIWFLLILADFSREFSYIVRAQEHEKQ